MNTTATAPKIRLTTVVPGYYCYNTQGYKFMFSIVKQDDTGLYRITDIGNEATDVTVRTLNEARAFIAKEITK